MRILGAAVLSLGVGAFAVAFDPIRNRSMLLVQIIFTGLSALALERKFLLDHSQRAQLWLVPLSALVVLLLVLYAATAGLEPRERPR